ncbi:tripartite tricarboxylate transporter substrate binding protein [Oceanobacillus timonensis]|uniref:tripartite tricarboxylate transporter substrate binding protein n=1 Tax=Oceanobacillus timonensis TaxID=1926285 RepID=UPI0009BC36A2|nr:tripartite tricarboxylate transporter substrate binding protein [Oceanobacillus timonensis]
MNKQWLIILLILLPLISMSACESQDEDTEGDEDSFPNRMLTYSIPFMPGGQSDVDARRQLPYLEESLNESVAIMYKDGAGGAIGWTELVNQPPDGHFFAGINIPHIILQPLTNDDTGYETDDIEPVVLFQRTPIGIAVSKDSGIETMEQFIEQSQKESITVSVTGSYSGSHLLALELESKANMNLISVPSLGSSETIQSVLSGTTTAVLANSPDLLSYKDDFNILAIGSEERFETLPDVPTFKELGLDITASIERGVAVPPGTSSEEIEKLETAFLDILANPEVQEEMIREGFEPLEMGADESQDFINQKREELEETLKIMGEIP